MDHRPLSWFCSSVFRSAGSPADHFFNTGSLEGKLMPAKPIQELRKGLIVVRIWMRFVKKLSRYPTSVLRLFRNGEAWKESSRFGPKDIPLLRLLLAVHLTTPSGLVARFFTAPADVTDAVWHKMLHRWTCRSAARSGPTKMMQDR